MKQRAKRNIIEGGGVLRQNVNNEKQKGRPTLKNLKDVQWMIEGDNDVIVLTSTLDIGRPANIGVKCLFEYCDSNSLCLKCCNKCKPYINIRKIINTKVDQCNLYPVKNPTVKILARWMCSDSTGGFSFWICWPVYSVSGRATDSIFFFLFVWDKMRSIGLYHRCRNHDQVLLSSFSYV